MAYIGIISFLIKIIDEGLIIICGHLFQGALTWDFVVAGISGPLIVYIEVEFNSLFYALCASSHGSQN